MRKEEKNKILKKIDNLLYNIRNEFENEIDCYESDYKEEIEETDFNIMFEFLDRYIGKVELYLKEIERSE